MTSFNVNIFSNAIYFCDAKLKFQQPLVQSSLSQDPSEIILICWFGDMDKHVFLLTMLKAVLLLNIFVDTMIHSLMNSKFNSIC